MIPGFARVDEVANFLKLFGTERACALGFEGTNNPMIATKEINFRLATLLSYFLTKSAL